MDNNQSMLAPQRSNVNGIVFECLIHPESKRALILLDGLPVVPYRKETINTIYQAGFTVFYPRFRGTWESDGQFLALRPSDDIKELIGTIVKGVKIGSGTYTSDDFYVLSSSFGGAVAWSLAEIKEVKKVILLSPVYDFGEVVGITTLKDYLRQFYTNGYRFKDQDWDRLLSNELTMLPADLSNGARRKCFVIGGESDTQIKANRLSEICDNLGITYIIYKNTDHISLLPKNKEVWNSIFTNLV